MKVVVEGKIAEDMLKKATIKDNRLQATIRPVLIDYSVFETSDPYQSMDDMTPLYTNMFKGAMVDAKNRRIIAIDSIPPNTSDCEIIAKQLNACAVVDLNNDEEVMEVLTTEPFNYTKEEAEEIYDEILNSNKSEISELLIVTAFVPEG